MNQVEQARPDASDEREHPLGSIVELLSEGVTLHGPDGAIRAWNRSAERILGDGPSLAGRRPGDPSWLTLLPDGTPLEPHEHPALVTLREGEEQRGRVLGLRRPDGALRWLSVNTQPLEVAGERCVVTSFSDITEARLADQRLRRALAELERSNAELEGFAYVASHDLSEPLRVITGFLDILRDRYGDGLDDDGRRYIEAARRGAARLDELIQALLGYSRLGRAELRLRRTSANVAARQALESLDSLVEASGATVRIEPLPTVRAEPTLLRQVFQNLLSNALKFRSEAAPEITVTARREDGAWRFVVEDNGLGIDPAQADRAFEVFGRLHAGPAEGTGMGLATVKRVVERHGGEVGVEPRAGGGSSFHFTLPAPEPPRGAAARGARAPVRR